MQSALFRQAARPRVERRACGLDRGGCLRMKSPCSRRGGSSHAGEGTGVGEFAVGQGVTRFEDPRLLRGGGRYVDDIMLPRMAIGYVLRSSHAHAAIRSIDTTQARGAPGVVLVLTGADWKRSGWGDLPVPGGQKRRDGSAMYRSPYPALAQERVRWVGDYVGFVVAETYAQAGDAAGLIDVDYEPLLAVTATADALAAGAPRVWADSADNT